MYNIKAKDMKKPNMEYPITPKYGAGILVNNYCKNQSVSLIKLLLFLLLSFSII